MEIVARGRRSDSTLVDQALRVVQFDCVGELVRKCLRLSSLGDGFDPVLHYLDKCDGTKKPGGALLTNRKP